MESYFSSHFYKQSSHQRDELMILLSIKMKGISVFEQTVLDSILPILKKTQKWVKTLNQLAKITTITFNFISNNSSKINKTVQEVKGKCPHCPKTISNNLFFILHLEMVHKQQIQITKYQVSHEQITIHFKKRQETSENVFLQETDKGGYMLKGKLSSRVYYLMQEILNKFVKKSDAARKQYFHSADIFRQVGEESQDEDSEAEIGKIQRQLEKLRINQFTDVNDSDKLFFVTWNNAIYESRKTCKLIDHEEMVNILTKFAVTAKALNIRRISLVMHAWTLWSAGKISPIDATTFLNAYETAPSLLNSANPSNPLASQLYP